MNHEDEAEEDGANIDLDSQRKGKCVVLKTSTRQVSNLFSDHQGHFFLCSFFSDHQGHFFRKRESHLVTFSSGQHCSQIDFVLARRKDKRACLDCKVIPGECVVSQHKLLVADFRFQVRARRDK